jgi:hypothetical protein
LQSRRPCAPVRIWRQAAAARAVGAHEFIMALPDGYGTELDQSGGGLSLANSLRIRRSGHGGSKAIGTSGGFQHERREAPS